MTNCFAEDRVPDLRGAEYAFIPRDDPEVDSLYSSGELVCLSTIPPLCPFLVLHRLIGVRQ